MIIVFPTSQYSPELVQPREQAFDLPSALVSTQHTPVLRGRPDAIALVGSDQRNVIDCELYIERIRVVGTIP
jgi:hypothetical protein